MLHPPLHKKYIYIHLELQEQLHNSKPFFLSKYLHPSKFRIYFLILQKFLDLYIGCNVMCFNYTFLALVEPFLQPFLYLDINHIFLFLFRLIHYIFHKVSFYLLKVLSFSHCIRLLMKFLMENRHLLFVVFQFCLAFI